MKNVILVAAIFALVSCKKENMEIKKVDHQKMSATKVGKLNVVVVNELDPICDMTTAEHLSDTANFKGKTYGFCSSYCKDEFKKNPEKYAVK